MTKKNARILLISEKTNCEEDIIIEEQEEVFYFNLKDSSRNRFSRKDKIFTRETEEMLLELNFKDVKESTIYLKKEHLEYHLDLRVIKYDEKETKIEIEYTLNNEEYLFKIELEGDKK